MTELRGMRGMFHPGYLKTHRPKKNASSRVCDETSPASPANTVLAVVLGLLGDLLLVSPFDDAAVALLAA